MGARSVLSFQVRENPLLRNYKSMSTCRGADKRYMTLE